MRITFIAIFVLVCVVLSFGMPNMRTSRLMMNRGIKTRRSDVCGSREELKADCKDILESPSFNDDKVTRAEMVCMYRAYGECKDTAEQLADESLADGDLDKNGMIDGNEIYGSPN